MRATQRHTGRGGKHLPRHVRTTNIGYRPKCGLRVRPSSKSGMQYWFDLLAAAARYSPRPNRPTSWLQ